MRQQRGAHSAFRVAASGAMASIPRIGEDDAYDENDGLHPVWLASNYLRRRKYDECIAICTDILAKNPYDQVRATFAPSDCRFPRLSDLPPRPPHPRPCGT